MPGSEGEAIRVLHVDDDEAFAEMAAEFLHREGEELDVETVASAAAGVERLAAASFDCVVSDYEMPETDGIEFLETVREEYPDLPFILFTGKGSEDVASEAISRGVTDYLRKGTGAERYELLANRIRNSVAQYRAQRRVDETERRYAALFEHTNDAIARVSFEDDVPIVQSVNPAFEELFLEEGERAEGRSVDEVVADEDSRAEATAVSERAAAGEFVSGELTRQTTEGPRHFLFQLVPVDDPDSDAVDAAYGVYTDVTDQKRQRERFQAFVEESTDVISVLAPDGTYQYQSPTVERVLGHDPGAMIGEDAFQYVHPDDRERVLGEFQAAISEPEATPTVEYRFRHADGSYRWLESRGNNQLDNPAVEGFVVNSRDVTERVERERELQQSHELIRALSTTFPDYTFIHNDEGEYLDVITGWQGGPTLNTREELLGQTVWDILDAEVAERIQTAIDEALAEEALRTVEYPVETPVGDYWYEGTVAPLPDGYEGERAVVLAARDVTERRERERDLERFQRIVSTMDDAVYALDPDGYIRTVNEGVLSLSGFDRDDLVGEHISILLDDDDIERGEELIGELMAGERERATYEVSLRTATDERVPCEVNLTLLPPEPDGSFAGTVGVARDVSDRKERERTLETLHDATREMMVAETGEEIAEIASRTATEVLDLPVNGIHLYDPEEDGLVPVATSPANREIIGEEPTIRPGEGLAWEVFETGEAQIHADVREAGTGYNPDTPIRSEMIFPLGDSGVLLVSSTTVGDFDDGDVALARVLAANVETALDRAERAADLERRTRELARQNERLEEFASIVSHDLRNPLNVAQGHLEMVAEECDSDHVRPVRRAHDRMAALIEDLLSLARAGELVSDVAEIDLSTAATRCWQSVDTGEATLEVETDRTVCADESRLQQLFENLVGNAVEHGGDDVTVTVQDVAGGFAVADDGPGIPADERESVFQFGYSSDPDGTGFGLAIVHEIASAHGWEIAVADAESGGARFEITGVEIVDAGTGFPGTE